MIEPLYLFPESPSPLPAYWLGLLLAFLACGLWFLLSVRKGGLKKGAAPAFLALALLLALLLGRAIFVLVRYETIFFDEMGEYVGLKHFFLPAAHGFSVAGVFLGALLAGFITARAFGIPAFAVFDRAAAPAALLFTLARLMEPLSGQGYGVQVTPPFPQFLPFSLDIGLGERLLSASFLSALLAFAVFLVLLLQRGPLKNAGFPTVFLLVFLTVPQIFPDSLRRDDALFIFVFARVSQIGFMLIFAGTALYVLLRSAARGAPRTGLIMQGLATLLLIGVCIGCEFALDKTNLPKAAVYLVLVLALGLMAFLTWRRMAKTAA